MLYYTWIKPLLAALQLRRYTLVKPLLASLPSRHCFEKIGVLTFNAVIETLGNHFNTSYTHFFIQVSDWQRSEYFQRVKDAQTLPIITGVIWTDNFAYSR